MDNSIENFLNNLSQSFLLSKVKDLKPDFSNINEVFSNNINIWYYFQSDKVTKKDGSEVNSKIDTINNLFLLNPESFIFSKSKDGFELTEIDFIQDELKALESVIIDKLSISEKKQLLFYIDYLKEERIKLNWSLDDYYNHYNSTGRFAFQVKYCSNDFDILQIQLNQYKKRFDFIFNKLTDDQRPEFYNIFSRELKKLKSKQSLTNFKELVQDLISTINKENNDNYFKNEFFIDEYKTSISGYFNNIIDFMNPDGIKNEFYYNDRIIANKQYKDSQLKDNTRLLKHYQILSNFNSILADLFTNTIDFFIAYHKYNIENTAYLNEINFKKDYIRQNLKQIKEYELIIGNFYLKSEFEEAVTVKLYCVNTFKSVLNQLDDDWCCIFLKNTPIYSEYLEALNVLEKSIDNEQIKITVDLNKQTSEKLQQTETIKTDEVFKFENNFDRVQCSIVYDYFKVELVNKKYLNEENFHAFLKIAFENSLQLQSKFKFEKKYIIKDIRAIFYKYYNEINFEKYKNQDKYIKLLTDYFEGFEFDKVKSNFNK